MDQHKAWQLVQRLQRNAADVGAWLALTDLPMSDAERRYCLERAREIDPENNIVYRGLARIGSGIQRRPSYLSDDRYLGGAPQVVATPPSAPTPASGDQRHYRAVEQLALALAYEERLRLLAALANSVRPD